MKRMTDQTRRDFLRKIGVSAAVAPFLPLLDSGAEAANYPKRLLLFYASHGFQPGAWEPTTTGSNYTVGPILAPLNPFLKKVVVTQGLHWEGQNVESHHSGLFRSWSGTDLDPGPSIDQMIAAQIGMGTSFPSIQLGVPGDSYQLSMIYAGVNQTISPEYDPNAALNRIFSSASAAQFTNRSRIADMLKLELAGIRKRVSAADYAKIDAHLTGLNALQKSTQSCAAKVVLTDYSNLPDGEQNMPAYWHNHMQIIANAFACDLTRVASIQAHGVVDDNTYAFANPARIDGHHSHTHNPTLPGADDALRTIQTFNATQFATLLGMLDAIPEGSGTVLDNTLVVWSTDMSDAMAHSYINMPFILAGSAGGSFKTGLSLKFDSRLTAHRLLVTICQGFGLSSVQSISNQDPSQGALSDLLA